MSDLTIRPLQRGETEVFSSYPFGRVPGLWESERDYAALLAAGEYRPEHTWVAIREDVVVARACWWAGPEDERPAALDWLEAEPGPHQVQLGTRLLLAAHVQMRNDKGARPDYHLFLPPAWRNHPKIKAAAEARMETARNAGLRPFVERLSFRWSASQNPTPKGSDRLRFRTADDAQMLPALRRVLVDTLDAFSRRDIDRRGLENTAEVQLQELSWFPSPREWWQLAYTSSNEFVGLVIPARNYERPIIAYIGVVPEHRGLGYVDDLLAEALGRLSEVAPGEEVAADTDRDNVPMAKAFARVGFRKTGERIVLTDAQI